MQVEKNCEHQAVETAKTAAREMQKKAAKSAESAGKNKGRLTDSYGTCYLECSYVLSLIVYNLLSFNCCISVELSALSEDNLSLKQKIQTLESELKK